MSRPFVLSRRAALLGTGVVLGLPMLEAMLPRRAFAGSPKAPLRLFVFLTGDGSPDNAVPYSFAPQAAGPSYGLTPCLKPLQTNGVQKNALVLSGLNNFAGCPAGVQNGVHEQLDPAILTGVNMTACQNINASEYPPGIISVDQAAALLTGPSTPGLPSLQIGTSKDAWCSTTSVRWTPSGPIGHIADIQAAFTRVFGGGGGTSAATQAAALKRQHYQTSILDYVQGQAAALESKLGAVDKARVDEYLTNVRALEVSIAGMASSQCNAGSTPAEPTDVVSAATAFLDLSALAFQCDVTRVISFMLESSDSQVQLPDTGAGWHNGVWHNPSGGTQEGNATANAWRIGGVTWQVDRFAYLLSKLQGMQDVDGSSVLANSAVVYTSEMGYGDGHWAANLPVIVGGQLGGAISSANGHTTFGDVYSGGAWNLYNTGRPMADLWLTILRGLGGTQTSFGNSTGPLSLT